MIQTWALLVDAYRELNSKKLFWITMILSLLVVGALASFGLKSSGFSFLWWSFDDRFLNSRVIPPEKFYKFMFAKFGIPLWLSWVASILALISTAGIIPDFISGGAIELSLSKPISRVRLFLTKYFTGLLFVGLQVSVFTVACMVVIGIRGKSWEPDLLLAIPIVVCFYSYLFCVCTLVGLVTRSTIAALLVTLLFWLFMWTLNVTDGLFVLQRETMIAKVERLEKAEIRQIAFAERQLGALKEMGQSLTDDEGNFPPGISSELEAANPLLASTRRDLVKAKESRKTWIMWSGIMVKTKTVLPKTAETIGLLERYMLTPEDLALLQRQGSQGGPVQVEIEDEDEVTLGRDLGANQRMEDEFRERPVWWIVGTSLGFEVFVLGLACVIFVRRDF